MPSPVIRSSEEEALHLEMERISLDKCMVQNPTNEDFYIEWYNTKGTPWKYLVPNKNKDIGWGKGKLEVERYLAIWYCEHMSAKIINDKGKAMWEKMMKEREEKGQTKLNEFEQQKAIWEKTPRTNSDTELANLYPNLFLGVTREFGQDYQPDEPYQANDKTVQDAVMDSLKNKKYTPNPAEKAVESKPELPPLESLEEIMPHTSREELVKEISAE